MIKFLFLGLALSIGLFAQSEIKQIAPEELKELINEKVFFLDVRTPKEISELGTLKGYVNIPIEELEKRMSEIPKDKKIITACNVGRRAARAAEMLKAKGYEVIGACGIKGAEQKGLELIHPKD